MSRLPPVDPTRLSPDQRRAYDEIVRVRGHVRGPFAIWLTVPEICEMALALQSWFPTKGKLPRRILELVILIAARQYTAQFAWHVHEGHGLSEGLSAEVLAALKERRPPPFERDDDQLVWEIMQEIDRDRTLSQPTYDRGLAAFGPDGMVELVAAAGFYVMVALTLNVFQAPVPGGAKPLD